jgi:ectoine hydroxylase-related dioxygenase (phytanoyl-CoA dioxygenase family)
MEVVLLGIKVNISFTAFDDYISDFSYWTRTHPMSHYTIHIALDDQTLENGCLHYIPGSHKWPLLPITSRHFGDMESIFEILNEEQKKKFKPTPMLLKKGEVAIHHSLTGISPTNRKILIFSSWIVWK